MIKKKPQEKEILPSTLSSFKIGSTQLLVGLLIIASFLLGSLFTKLQYLERSNATGTPLGAVPNPPTAQKAPAPQAPAGKIKNVTDKDHIRGNKDAKVSVVEFSDYECPFCKRFHPTMLNLVKTYGDRVRFIYRHFPLAFHQNAQKQAEASECIAELAGNDAFWKYTDIIFERTTSNGTGFALEKLGPLAAELGLDQTEFQSCLDSGKYAQHVKDDMADGSAAGVSGTPSTFIIDSKGKSQIIVGAQPESAFTAVLDQVLKN